VGSIKSVTALAGPATSVKQMIAGANILMIRNNMFPPPSSRPVASIHSAPWHDGVITTDY
jgi:hypothetical protein